MGSIKKTYNANLANAIADEYNSKEEEIDNNKSIDGHTKLFMHQIAVRIKQQLELNDKGIKLYITRCKEDNVLPLARAYHFLNNVIFTRNSFSNIEFKMDEFIYMLLDQYPINQEYIDEVNNKFTKIKNEILEDKTKEEIFDIAKKINFITDFSEFLIDKLKENNKNASEFVKARIISEEQLGEGNVSDLLSFAYYLSIENNELKLNNSFIQRLNHEAIDFNLENI